MRPLRSRAAVKHQVDLVERETRGHCWTVHYSNCWDGCRRSQIDPSAYGKLFVEVHSLVMTSFPFLSSASSKAIGCNKSIVIPDPESPMRVRVSPYKLGGKGRGERPDSPFCSRNARPQKALVRRAQLRTIGPSPSNTREEERGRGNKEGLAIPCAHATRGHRLPSLARAR